MTQTIDQPLYDLSGAAMKLGNVSRSTLYRLIDQGKLVRVNIGTKAVITGESLARYVEELKATTSENLAHDATPDPALEREKTARHSTGH
jgi:excisionase family DNA binding protein